MTRVLPDVRFAPRPLRGNPEIGIAAAAIASAPGTE
jgi:hypothetical protein